MRAVIALTMVALGVLGAAGCKRATEQPAGGTPTPQGFAGTNTPVPAPAPEAAIAIAIPPGYPQGLPYVPGNAAASVVSPGNILLEYPSVAPAQLQAAFESSLGAAGWATYFRGGDVITVCHGVVRVGVTFTPRGGGTELHVMATTFIRPLPPTGCPAPGTT